MVPLFPVNDKIPLFCPEQIEEEVDDKVPPILGRTISINAGVENAIGEIPFCTATLYYKGVLVFTTV